MENAKKHQALEDRLIDFGVRAIRLAEALPGSRIGGHVAGQILRSGTSPAPNYAEARDAESRVDFVHKMKVCLKELRETRVWLITIDRAGLVKPPDLLAPLIDECNQLICTFVASLRTTKREQSGTRSSQNDVGPGNHS